MLSSNGHALLIGIEDYSVFDRSIGRPRGTSDLLGGRNDVRAFWQICLAMGMKPENIRVLTSPALDPAELKGASPENVGEATEEEILDKIAWLAARLGAPEKPAGLLTYSGHGDLTLGKGLVVCPSDVAGYDLDRSISFSALESALEREGASDNLTVVLDACHAGRRGENGDERRTSSLTGRPLPSTRAPVGLDKASRRISKSRVLAASRVDQPAYQAKLSGAYRGAFSWALCSALEQWKAEQEGDNVRVGVGYDELVARAGRLLAALSFPQAPELHAPSGVAGRAFFHREHAGGAEEVSPEPDALRLAAQLDPGIKGYCIFEMTYTAGATVSTSKVLTANTGHNTGSVTYTAADEFWSLSSVFKGHVNSPASGATLQLDGSAGTQDWPHSGQPSGFPVSGALALFKMPAVISSWTAVSTAPTGLFVKNTSTTDNAAIEFNLTAPVPPSTTWSGTITWYVLSRNTPTGYVLAEGTSATFTEGNAPAPATNYSWYKVILSPSVP